MSEIGTMSGMFNANNPDARNIGNEGLGALSAQNQAAPGQYNAVAQWAPQYASLAGQLFGQTLAGQYSGLAQSAGLMNQLSAGSRSAQRAADVGDVASLGPQALAAARGADPGRTGLIDSLTQQAQQGIDAGMSLTPGETRQYQQNIRGAQAARGLGYGPADVYSEAMTLGEAGRNLQNQRLAQAQNVAQLRQASFGDPWSVVGRSQSVAPDANAILGQAGGNASSILGSTQQQFNPFNQYASAANAGNYQGQLQTNLTNAQITSQGAAGFDKSM